MEKKLKSEINKTKQKITIIRIRKNWIVEKKTFSFMKSDKVLFERSP